MVDTMVDAMGGAMGEDLALSVGNYSPKSGTELCCTPGADENISIVQHIWDTMVDAMVDAMDEELRQPEKRNSAKTYHWYLYLESYQTAIPALPAIFYVLHTNSFFCHSILMLSLYIYLGPSCGHGLEYGNTLTRQQQKKSQQRQHCHHQHKQLHLYNCHNHHQLSSPSPTPTPPTPPTPTAELEAIILRVPMRQIQNGFLPPGPAGGS